VLALPGAVWAMLLALLTELPRLAGQLLLAPPGLSGAAVAAAAVGVLVGAIAVGLACAAWLGRVSALAPLLGRASALREKSWRAGFLRQRDPDAAGRPRPRAPSAAPAAA
jgi:Family of unknown function (DUF6412)